jgi:STE24 endopeptidase
LLHRLNISSLRQKGDQIPRVFQGTVDLDKLKKIVMYTVDSSRVSMAATLAGQAIFLVIVLSGFLPWLAAEITHREFGIVLGGLLFFAALSIITNLFQLPFSLYDTFVVENRYGFNTMTLRMWLLDLIKSWGISSLLGGLILGLLLTLVSRGSALWWIWAWILLGLFELLLLWLFPVVIAPLFNTFEPISNEDLIHHIEALMGKVGLRVKGVFRMDASKRSKHTNAYFTGVGRSKRIVLFDTLLESHAEDEILAVLAHEIGHWKKKHVLQHLILLEIVSFVGLWGVAKLLDWPTLYGAFGFQKPISYAGLFLIGAYISLVGYFATPLGSVISRKFERVADDFSLRLLGTAEPMVRALKRLAADNLSNVSPHPLYAWFYYSHPPLVERIERLEKGQPGSARSCDSDSKSPDLIHQTGKAE